MVYRICRLIVRLVFKMLYRYEVTGRENVPEKGATLICANHIHNFDPFMVGSSVKRPVYFMAKAEIFKYPLIAAFFRQLNAFPVKRGAADKRAIRKSLETLRNEQGLIIFPEGTRSKTGQLQKAFSGAGMIALKEPCVVVPAAVVGPYKLFRKVKVIFGKPVYIDDLRGDKVSRDQAQEATERMMNTIRELLEDHPAK
jgi:1-acyl-sn-glycerol-3-phosphate acyltransferase